MESRAGVVEAVARCVEEQYVDATAGRAAADHLRSAQVERGADWPARGQGLATTLTAELRSALPDLHLSVRWSDEVLEPSRESQWDDPAFLAAYWESEALTNFGFERAVRLPGNVGLMEVHSIDEPEGTGSTIDAAFAFLARVSALVVDLRSTNGGAPSGVAHFLGHLLPAGTPLVDVVDRQGRVTESTRVPDDASRTLPDDAPVFVLTGPGTVSGCEELAYDLRAYGRAVLVGGTTVGAANPVDSVVVDPHVVVRIPTGRVVHAVTGGNWEGAGLEPDHACPAEQALEVAHRLALETVRARLSPGPASAALRAELDEALAPVAH